MFKDPGGAGSFFLTICYYYFIAGGVAMDCRLQGYPSPLLISYILEGSRCLWEGSCASFRGGTKVVVVLGRWGSSFRQRRTTADPHQPHHEHPFL